MIFDSHTHSRFSTDSKAEPRDMMEAALKKGLAGLCVTDHYDCDEIPAFCTLENLRGAKAALAPLRQEYADLLRRMDTLRTIDRAKYLLMQYLGMSEAQAHRYIERQAMNLRVSKKVIAEHIRKTYDN